MCRVAVIDDWDRVCQVSPAIADLAREVELTVHTDHVEDLGELARRLEETEILIPFRERTRLDERFLAALPRLRLIAQTGGGVAHIDVVAATRRAVAIAVTPGASATSVAELALGLILALYHRIAEGDRLLRGGGWSTVVGRDVAGRTLGIAGFGHVGQALAPRATALGMSVLVWSRRRPATEDALPYTFVGSFDELLARSDCLSLHLPLTPETEGLVTEEKLRQMRAGSMLINTARGGLVVEADLIRALQDGVLAGAGLDVYAQEPLPSESPLRRLPNVVLTPHAGWTTQDTQERYLQRVVENIRAFLAGRRDHLLNGAALDQGRC